MNTKLQKCESLYSSVAKINGIPTCFVEQLGKHLENMRALRITAEEQLAINGMLLEKDLTKLELLTGKACCKSSLFTKEYCAFIEAYCFLYKCAMKTKVSKGRISLEASICMNIIIDIYKGAQE